METVHHEDDSPWAVSDDASIAAIMALQEQEASEDSIPYVHCHVEGCGEQIPLIELESHVELHSAEREDEDDESSAANHKSDPQSLHRDLNLDQVIPPQLRNLEHTVTSDSSKKRTRSPSPQRKARAAWRDMLNMPDVTSKKTSTSASSSKGKGRLGVGLWIVLVATRLCLLLSRKRSLDRMPTNQRCQLGWSNCSTKMVQSKELRSRMLRAGTSMFLLQRTMFPGSFQLSSSCSLWIQRFHTRISVIQEYFMSRGFGEKVRVYNMDTRL